MKKLVTLLFVSHLFAQQYTIDWQKTLGGSSYEYYEGFNSTIVTQASPGYIVCGGTHSNDFDITGNHGNFDGMLIKLDANHNITWQKCYGGVNQDDLSTVIELEDGYIACGETHSMDSAGTYHGSGDSWIVRTDFLGNEIWKKCYGGSGLDNFLTMQKTTDGGFILLGTTKSSNGDVTDFVVDLFNSFDTWVVKIDGSGNIEWEKVLGDIPNVSGTAKGGEIAWTVFENSDNTFTTVYMDRDGGTDDDTLVLAKLDGNNGSLLFRNAILPHEAFISDGVRINNKFALVGSYFGIDPPPGYHGDTDILYLLIDETGVVQTAKCLGGSGTNNWEAASTITPFEDGFLIGGSSTSANGDFTSHYGSYTEPDIFISKTDTLGNIEWLQTFGGTATDYISNMEIVNDSNIIFLGTTSSSDYDIDTHYGYDDYWLVQLKINDHVGINEEIDKPYISMYPNPAQSSINISINNYTGGVLKIELFNVLGMMVYTELSTVEKTFTLPLDQLSPGNYYYQIRLENGSIHRGKFSKI